MADSTKPPLSDRQRLERSIAALEAQRARIGDEAADAAVASLRRELSNLKAAETEPSRRKEGERRVVTVLFSDVTGSTALAESMDPEEWTEIMNAVFERLIEPVERYGGVVARLMGDAILAFFGAPIAHEDDPQRAVLAGLAIQESIQPLREQLQRDRNLSFNVRVGINTGLAVVGEVGSDTAGEYTAMGDAVNLAARMEQTAEPGTVQIADNTYRLVASQFEFEDIGGIAVKGKTEPVQSYRVVGRKAIQGRTRGIPGLDSPLIGREREQQLLAGILSALDGADGSAIVCLTGEAGLGKSRLIRELRDSAGPAYSWYETASLSYESSQPYSMFRRLMRRMAGAGPDDPPARMRERIRILVQLFPPTEQEEIGQLMASLFGLPGVLGEAPLEGEAFKRRLFSAMTALWEEQLRRGPLILVCDDLDWADAASAALLQHLLPLVERGPLLILLASRADVHTPGWGVIQAAETRFSHRCTSVRLQPLSDEEGSRLVDSLLTISDLPPRLRVLIQEKTEGNPFFVEEVVRTLIDDGVVVRDADGARWRAAGEIGDIEIPDNVQALLAARIDRLGERARTILKLAAVVGRSFYYRLLAGVVDLVRDLDAQLLALQQAQFIQEAARLPELEYIFRHALTQEAAYNAILLRQRRAYHRQVGEVLVSLYPDRQEEFAGALAFHFFQARDYPRALRYSTLAGDASYRLYAVTEAIEHYGRAIECTANIDGVASEQLVHLYIRRGRAYKLDNQFDKAEESYQRLLELAQQRDDPVLRLASLTAQCIIRASPTPLHDPPQARALADQALPLARELGDRAAEARVLWGLLLAESWGGDIEQALTHGRQSLKIARAMGLTQQIGYTLHHMAALFLHLEQYDESKRANLEEREAWQRAGNTPMLADSYLTTASLNLFVGQYQAAIADAAEAQRISRTIDNQSIQCVAPYYIGWALLEQGDAGRAQENIQQGLKLSEQEGIAWYRYAGYIHLLLLYRSMGALQRAAPVAEELYRNREQLMYGFISLGLTRVARLELARGDLKQAQKFHAASLQGVDADKAPIWFMAEVSVTGALLRLAVGQPEAALSETDQLVERTRRSGTKSCLAEALLVRGKAMEALGRFEQAADGLREAASVAEEIGQRRVLWQILAALAVVETRQANTVAAQTARRRAREIIDDIADHAGDDELRESFLGTPEVRSVLAA